MTQNSFVVPATTPTTELAAVNVMLSGIGETPVNSLTTEATADVSLARSILNEISKEVQTEGWQWNTEDNYPLTPDNNGNIKVHNSIIRVQFREPDARELTLRGNQVYDRVRHTYKFDPKTVIYVTITMLLDFDQLPEAARRYTTIRALRTFQERVVGSNTLSSFHQTDEARARALMLAEERREDTPNMLLGTLPPAYTWRPVTALMHRGHRRTGSFD